jgi:hypothetical protein
MAPNAPEELPYRKITLIFAPYITNKNDMKTGKTSGKAGTPKRKEASPQNRKKKLSSIARYWETVDSNDFEIIDMRAVLK